MDGADGAGVDDVATRVGTLSQELNYCCGRMLQVLVHGDDPVAGTVEHAFDRRGMLPEIAGKMEDGNPGLILGNIVEHVRRVVDGGIVDENEFFN